MIKFHDPRGDVATEVEDYTLNFAFNADGEGVTFGLLANGFPDSEAFLHKLADVIKQKFSKATVKVWNKGNASIPAPQDMLDEIQASCQIAIAAYGH